MTGSIRLPLERSLREADLQRRLKLGILRMSVQVELLSIGTMQHWGKPAVQGLFWICLLTTIRGGGIVQRG